MTTASILKIQNTFIAHALTFSRPPILERASHRSATQGRKGELSGLGLPPFGSILSLDQPLRSSLTLPSLHEVMVQTRARSSSERGAGGPCFTSYHETEKVEASQPSHVDFDPEEKQGKVPCEQVISSQASTASEDPGELSFTIPDDLDPVYTNALEGRNKCMFVSRCNTGSILRKAISHFFGRNKDCTKRIPNEIWVYYCRKHYQRIRYRNAKLYPLNQMELVLWQMRRLQAWDIACQRTGNAARIEYWAFALRKREEQRLQNIESGDSDAQGAGAQNSSNPAWIKESVGSRYSTDQIIAIAQRLYNEIHQGRLSSIPEVEFLPQIVDEQTKEARKPRRCQQNGNAPKVTKRKAKEPLDEASTARSALSRQEDPTAKILQGDVVHLQEKRLRMDGSPTDIVPDQSRHTHQMEIASYIVPTQPSQSSAPRRHIGVMTRTSSPGLRELTSGPALFPPIEHGRPCGYRLTENAWMLQDESRISLPQPRRLITQPSLYPEPPAVSYSMHYVTTDSGYHHESNQSNFPLPPLSTQMAEEDGVPSFAYQRCRRPSEEGMLGPGYLRPRHHQSGGRRPPAARSSSPRSIDHPLGRGCKEALRYVGVSPTQSKPDIPIGPPHVTTQEASHYPGLGYGKLVRSNFEAQTTQQGPPGLLIRDGLSSFSVFGEGRQALPPVSGIARHRTGFEN